LAKTSRSKVVLVNYESTAQLRPGENTIGRQNPPKHSVYGDTLDSR
jgi:hypothetical protein